MMLQGHFIDTLLQPYYRNKQFLVYEIWHYFRGNTAPIFFTISGLIFTYLLLRSKENNNVEVRIKKGLKRGLSLLCIGYALRIPIHRWIKGSFDYYFLVVDVLQCIGLSLILIILFYMICKKNTRFFSIIMFIIGTFIFILEPVYRNLHIEQLPQIIVNYLSKQNGSIFTIIPWFGYMAYGAFIATLFHKFLHKRTFKTYVICSFLIVGAILSFWSSSLLYALGNLSQIEIIIQAANFNYLFSRLGNVLICFGIFYSLEKYIKNPTFLKIGQHTLSVYVIHFIILYGSFTGLGLNRIIGKNLSPWEAIFGAIAFLIVISWLSMQYSNVLNRVVLKIRKYDKMQKKS